MSSQRAPFFVWLGLAVLLVAAAPPLAHGATVYSWGFDDPNDPSGFWAPSNGLWQFGPPAAGPAEPHSLPNCAGTNLAGLYPRYTDSRLESPTIVLPSIAAGEEIVLRFWHWFAYFNEPNATDDNGQIQINVDGGGWNTVYTVWYSSASWSPCQIDLTAHAGKSIRIGFYHDDNYGTYGSESYGWYVDDVTVEARPALRFDQSRVEDFEAGWDGWWATNGVWEVGAPTSGPPDVPSPVSCAGTFLSGNYPRYTGTRLVSPPIDVKIGTPSYFRFQQWFSYFNEPNATDDRGRVDLQIFDNGEWQPWETKIEVTFSSGGWSSGQIELTAYAGKLVRVSFYHQDYYGTYGSEAAGWYIDDVEVAGGDVIPTLDIRVNGFNGPLTVSPADDVSVTVALDPGTYAGTPAEVWVGTLSFFGAFWCDPVPNWSMTRAWYRQEPLSPLPETEVLNQKIPPGLYTFFLILDGVPNNAVDIGLVDCALVICK